jgi:hypothetical protein
MTDRQARYKLNRLIGMRKVSAAIAAGYSQNYAENSGKRLAGKKKEKVRTLKEWLEIVGITEKQLAKHAQEGLEAVKNSGNPDWTARANYFKNVLMLLGHLKQGEESGSVNNINIRVVRYDGASVQSPRLAISNLLGQN